MYVVGGQRLLVRTHECAFPADRRKNSGCGDALWQPTENVDISSHSADPLMLPAVSNTKITALRRNASRDELLDMAGADTVALRGSKAVFTNFVES